MNRMPDEKYLQLGTTRYVQATYAPGLEKKLFTRASIGGGILALS